MLFLEAEEGIRVPLWYRGIGNVYNRKKIYNYFMKKIIVGHKGLIGYAIMRKLKKKGYKNIITADKKKLNLLNQNEVFKFLKKKIMHKINKKQ